MTTPAGFTLWTERTDRGEELRATYERKSEAIENAEKYWLTAVGLFRVMVKDSADNDAVVFNKTFQPPRQTKADRARALET